MTVTEMNEEDAAKLKLEDPEQEPEDAEEEDPGVPEDVEVVEEDEA